MIQIMIVFSIIAGIDKILNNKFGLGEKFEEGFKAMGDLALSIIGIYSLSPIIGEKLMIVLGPLSKLINVDPSVFLSSILAVDLGGYNTSIEIANSSIIGEFNGLILASTLGATISFTIPVAVGLISKEDFKFFAKGILGGITALPLGMIVGGVIMGIEFMDIVYNLVPVIIFSILIICGLLKFPDKMVKTFNILGKVIVIISTIGLILNIISFIFGYNLIPGMIPLEEGILLVAKIGIILSGAYPMFHFISQKLNKFLSNISEKVGLDEYSVLGILSSLANCIPMLGIYDKMNEKGKVINASFIVSGAFTFGGQLAYISSVSPDNINPFIVSKLVGGIFAIFISILFLRLEKVKEVKYDY
ncbi:ethanolamine utilization protein EutH [Tissierella pigra]|nr:ethanolamine utilization protein EutH [Tissierella pigra]